MFNTSSSAYVGTVEIVLDESKQKALKTAVFRALIFTRILFKCIFVSGSSKIAEPYKKTISLNLLVVDRLFRQSATVSLNNETVVC